LPDVIEVPNLAQRGQQFWSYLLRRYVFRTRAFAVTRYRDGGNRWAFRIANERWTVPPQLLMRRW